MSQRILREPAAMLRSLRDRLITTSDAHLAKPIDTLAWRIENIRALSDFIGCARISVILLSATNCLQRMFPLLS